MENEVRRWKASVYILLSGRLAPRSPPRVRSLAVRLLRCLGQEKEGQAQMSKARNGIRQVSLPDYVTLLHYMTT